jgi:hypothetical protein
MGRSSDRKKQVQKAAELPGYQKKVPRVDAVLDRGDHTSARVLWSFAYFDDYDWGTSGEGATAASDSFFEIAKKLKSYSTRTWNEIRADRKRDHSAQPAQLCKKAQERLRTIQLDDVDVLFRFRLTGTHRLWGYQCGQYFVVLWWDPDHQVWPMSGD